MLSDWKKGTTHGNATNIATAWYAFKVVGVSSITLFDEKKMRVRDVSNFKQAKRFFKAWGKQPYAK